MGHDIYARTQSQIDESEAICEELRIDDYSSDGWSERYEKYRERTQVAYLRRTMGDPANKHVYLALNAMDCYGGVSGTGESRTYSAGQIHDAADAVLKLDKPAVTELHPVAARFKDNLEGLFSAAGFGESQIETAGEDPNEVYQPEREFFADIIKHFIDSGDRSIVVEFG